MPEDGFEEEAVQLNRSCEPEDGQNRKESSGRREHLPVVRRQLARSQLSEGRKQSESGWGILIVVLHASPVVGLHLKPVHDKVTDPDSDTVAQENVEDNLIPPALSKVGQNVCKCQLAKFKENAPAPRYVDVAEEERLSKPSEKMSDDEFIKNSIMDILKTALRILWRVHAAVAGVVALRQRLAKLWVNEGEHTSRLVLILNGQLVKRYIYRSPGGGADGPKTRKIRLRQGISQRIP